MNAALAERYPKLRRRIVERGDEIIAHGLHMDALHHSEVDPEVEAAQVQETVETLRALTGQSILGWLSPGKSQSFVTPELLPAQGIEYMCD